MRSSAGKHVASLSPLARCGSLSGRVLLLATFTTVLVGCPSSERTHPSATQATAVRAAPAETIEKYGRTWRFAGEATDRGGVAVTCAGIPRFAEWINVADRDSRLLVVIAPEDENSSQWAKITREQKRINGKWVSEGVDRTVYRDGRVHEGSNHNGELHGIARFYADNGQLIDEKSLVNGVQQGVAKGWYDDGTPRYEAIYKNGKEVSGKAWSEDGTLIDAND